MKLVEEEKPDELDLHMIAEAEVENDGSAIPFEDMARELEISVCE